MKLAIIGMGIMGCNYAKMISAGHTKGIEITAVTRITPERRTELKDVFDKGAKIYQSADAVDGKTKIFVEGAEGSKSLMLANAMYLSSWKKQMVDIPKTKEEELDFEKEYEMEFFKKKTV